MIEFNFAARQKYTAPYYDCDTPALSPLASWPRHLITTTPTYTGMIGSRECLDKQLVQRRVVWCPQASHRILPTTSVSVSHQENGCHLPILQPRKSLPSHIQDLNHL